MKKHKYILLLVLIFLSLGNTAMAQDPQTNLNKYWHLRYRFNKYFEYVGMRGGMSCPATSRNTDPNGDDNGACLNWEDGPVTLGYYIGVLATEYRLLADNHQDVSETTKELYYALHTVYRLDSMAYSIYVTFPNPAPAYPGNGCMVRDDADNLGLNLGGPQALLNSGLSANNTQYIIPCSGIVGYANCVNTETNYLASVDNYLTILIGLSLVHQLVDDYNFSWQETNSNTGKSYTFNIGPGTGSYPVSPATGNSATIHQMADDLAYKIFDYLSQGDWGVSAFGVLLFPNGNPLFGYGDGDPGTLSYPLYNWSKNLFGYTVQTPTVGAKDLEWQDFWDGCGNSYCLNTWNVQACEAAAGSDAGPNSNTTALDMLNFLGGDNQCSSCSGNVWYGRNIFWSGILEILYPNTYDITSWDYCSAQSFINLCPYDGPFHHACYDNHGNPTSCPCIANAWGSDRRWGDDQSAINWPGGTWGNFTGLDYMLLYNVYCLQSERRLNINNSFVVDNNSTNSWIAYANEPGVSSGPILPTSSSGYPDFYPFDTYFPNNGNAYYTYIGSEHVSGGNGGTFTISATNCSPILINQLNVSTNITLNTTAGNNASTSSTDNGSLIVQGGTQSYIDLNPTEGPIIVQGGSYFDAVCNLSCCLTTPSYYTYQSDPGGTTDLRPVPYQKSQEFDTLYIHNGIISYPNPFRNQTTIVFSLEYSSNVNIYITDNTGKKIKDLVENSAYAKGFHNITYNGSNLSAGSYICVLETSSNIKQTFKMVKGL